MKVMTKKFYWTAQSSDGWTDKSSKMFDNEKDAYNDMRNAVLEKMKWNTEYDEDFEEDTTIGYNVLFNKNKIVHTSYSGVYTYQIKEHVEIPKEQIIIIKILA